MLVITQGVCERGVWTTALEHGDAASDKYFEIPGSAFLLQCNKSDQAKLIPPGLICANQLPVIRRARKQERNHITLQLPRRGALNTLYAQSLSSSGGGASDGGLSEGRVWNRGVG